MSFFYGVNVDNKKHFYGRIDFSDHAFELLKLSMQGVTLEQWATAVQRMSTGVADYPVCEKILAEAREFTLKKSEACSKAGLVSAKKRAEMRESIQQASTGVEHTSTEPNPVTVTVTETKEEIPLPENQEKIIDPPKPKKEKSISPASGDAETTEKPNRKKNELWDAVVSSLGFHPITKQAASRLGAAIKALRVHQATPYSVWLSTVTWKALRPGLDFPSIEKFSNEWYPRLVAEAMDDKNETRIVHYVEQNNLVCPYEMDKCTITPEETLC